jgi:hypothetical protein
MVEAFKFEDVRLKKKNAPCIWATFIVANLNHGQTFSSVLRGMAEIATPYFGMTTNGVQVHAIQPGRVLVGSPVEVRGPPKALQPPGQASH